MIKPFLCKEHGKWYCYSFVVFVKLLDQVWLTNVLLRVLLSLLSSYDSTLVGYVSCSGEKKGIVVEFCCLNIMTFHGNGHE